ncbi:MAG: 16S rRNA (cytosine(1402)-N(4))-methyltransferase RsmH [Pseudomonadota bacterium]
MSRSNEQASCEAAVLSHVPVLLDEALEALAIRADGVYVDGTFGRGGHAARILQCLGPAGRLHVFDRDPQAIAVAQERMGGDARVVIHPASFAEMAPRLDALGLVGRVEGVLLDIGVSSPQLDDAARGFSFMRDGPLDMRMNPAEGSSAADFLAHASVEAIADVLWRLGEERHSRRIARAIVARREQAPLRRTRELAELIAAVVPGREIGKHPATRSFQALRIHVNGELEALERGLAGAVQVLAPEGRLAVISFHSLEDRIVKRFMRDASRPELDLLGRETAPAQLRVLGKPRMPGEDELTRNPRARSAVLRVASRRAEGGQ